MKKGSSKHISVVKQVVP
jgi:hypothetical protein